MAEAISELRRDIHRAHMLYQWKRSTRRNVINRSEFKSFLLFSSLLGSALTLITAAMNTHSRPLSITFGGLAAVIIVGSFICIVRD